MDKVVSRAAIEGKLPPHPIASRIENS